MKQQSRGNPFPKGALYGAAALIAFAIAAAGFSRLAPDQGAPLSAEEAAASRDLRFEDQADGSVAIYAAPGARLVATLAPGSNGFARALLRGMARERKRVGVGSAPPFRLTLRTDGGLILEDPVNGRLVDLGAFGATNAQVFARLLDDGRSMQ